MFIFKREYDLLQKELVYWRTKYEDEHARAERLVATLLQTNGLPAPEPKDAEDSGSDHQHFLKRLERTIPELLAESIEDSLEEDTTETEA